MRQGKHRECSVLEATRMQGGREEGCYMWSTESAKDWPLGLAMKTAVVMVRGAVWSGDSQSVIQKGTGEEKYATRNMESNLKSLAIEEKRKEG